MKTKPFFKLSALTLAVCLVFPPVSIGAELQPNPAGTDQPVISFEDVDAQEGGEAEETFLVEESSTDFLGTLSPLQQVEQQEIAADNVLVDLIESDPAVDVTSGAVTVSRDGDSYHFEGAAHTSSDIQLTYAQPFSITSTPADPIAKQIKIRYKNAGGPVQAEFQFWVPGGYPGYGNFFTIKNVTFLTTGEEEQTLTHYVPTNPEHSNYGLIIVKLFDGGGQDLDLTLTDFDVVEYPYEASGDVGHDFIANSDNHFVWTGWSQYLETFEKTEDGGYLLEGTFGGNTVLQLFQYQGNPIKAAGKTLRIVYESNLDFEDAEFKLRTLPYSEHYFFGAPWQNTFLPNTCVTESESDCPSLGIRTLEFQIPEGVPITDQEISFYLYNDSGPQQDGHVKFYEIKLYDKDISFDPAMPEIIPLPSPGFVLEEAQNGAAVQITTDFPPSQTFFRTTYTGDSPGSRGGVLISVDSPQTPEIETFNFATHYANGLVLGLDGSVPNNVLYFEVKDVEGKSNLFRLINLAPIGQRYKIRSSDFDLTGGLDLTQIKEFRFFLTGEAAGQTFHVEWGNFVFGVPPVGSAVLAEGAEYTATRSVPVELNIAEGEPVEVAYCFDGGASCNLFQALAGFDHIEIPEDREDGPVTVTFQLRDAQGLTSEFFDAQIQLDTTPPVTAIQFVPNAPYTLTLNVTLRISGEDAGIGIASLLLSLDGGNSWQSRSWIDAAGSGYMDINFDLPVGGLNTVLVKLVDHLGLESEPTGAMVTVVSPDYFENLRPPSEDPKFPEVRIPELRRIYDYFKTLIYNYYEVQPGEELECENKDKECKKIDQYLGHFGNKLDEVETAFRENGAFNENQFNQAVDDAITLRDLILVLPPKI